MAKRKTIPQVLTGVCEDEPTLLSARVTRIENNDVWVSINGYGYILDRADIASRDIAVGDIVAVDANIVPRAIKSI